MMNQVEQLLIRKFIIHEKQERYLHYLSNDKSRNKFVRELYHFKDFNWSLLRPIPGNEIPSNSILQSLRSKKRLIVNCHVISVNQDLDKRAISIEQALESVIGEEGTILIFGEVEIVYYEGEAPGNRFISIE